MPVASSRRGRRHQPNGWRSVIDLNLNGTWAMTQVFGDQMLDAVAAASCSRAPIVGRGLPGIAHAATGKAWPVSSSSSRRSAFESGPTVRVNCVAPGAFRRDESGGDLRQGRQRHVEHPTPVPGRPSDIANATVFLASPAAAFVTGQCLYVDGGHVLH